MRIIGRRSGIPERVLQEIDKTIEMSASNTGTRLCLAINYGSRGEITDAVRKLANDVQEGRLAPADIDEDCVEEYLYTRGMPDPDLVIRTAGELRISNFLLWQISYAELWVTNDCWPEFELDHLQRAISDFGARDRRFGGLNNQ